jgi:hypothetical protein
VGGDDARRRRDLEKRRDRDNLFVARRKVPPRGSTSRPRETRGYAVCQAKESLAFLPILLLQMPTCPKCQTQMPNHWTLFFSFLANSKMQKPFANSLRAALIY